MTITDLVGVWGGTKYAGTLGIFMGESGDGHQT